MTASAWGKLLLLGALWGGSFYFARVAVQEIAPLALVLLRVGIAAAALQVYLLAAGIAFRPVLAAAPIFFLLALVNNVIPFSLMFFGQTELGAGLASVINATTPFWTILVAAALTADEKITARKLAGVAVGIAGTAVMIGPGLLVGIGGPAWAKLALMGTAISYAFAFVVARRISGFAPAQVATGQLTASTAIMLPVVLTLYAPSEFLGASGDVWAAVLGLALLATALGYILYFALVAEAGATNASLVTFVVPVSAVLLGVLLLDERLEAFELGGMALIGCGLAVIDGRLLRRFTGAP